MRKTCRWSRRFSVEHVPTHEFVGHSLELLLGALLAARVVEMPRRWWWWWRRGWKCFFFFFPSPISFSPGMTKIVFVTLVSVVLVLELRLFRDVFVSRDVRWIINFVFKRRRRRRIDFIFIFEKSKAKKQKLFFFFPSENGARNNHTTAISSWLCILRFGWRSRTI